jgi:aminoglycoside phosphotransferase (APT) family kinase protein/RimJ/RimL family protein N-acetyltransferase
MLSDAQAIAFRPLAMADLPLLHHWLNHTPSVREHYAHGQETPYEQVAAKYAPRTRGETPTSPYLILCGETPIGYIQTYLWKDYPDYARFLELQEEAASLDLFIGHPDYLHRGLGHPLLRAFLRDVLFADSRVASCVITPEVKNESALRAYAKAGFQHLRVIDHPDEPGPISLMRIGREEVPALPIRARYLTEPLPAEDLRPVGSDEALAGGLPAAITALTGANRQVRLPEQGVCNLLLLLEAEPGTFALKVARAGYRSQELQAEHAAMLLLHESDVPVPHSLAFTRAGQLSFQLRAYSPGRPLSAMLAEDECLRPQAIGQMGQTLAAIHSVRPSAGWSREQWLDASLERAALNLATGACLDPEEFTSEEPPEAVLAWLRANRPAGAGEVCLLHGDYRPKNLLWADGRVCGVIDWAFVDVGDPYYDLSVMQWYMRDETEWQTFLSGYGLVEVDAERLRYYGALQKFLNV